MVPVALTLWEYFVYEHLRGPHERALMQTARTQATRKMQQLMHVQPAFIKTKILWLVNLNFLENND